MRRHVWAGSFIILLGVYVVLDGGTKIGAALVLMGALHLMLWSGDGIPGIDPALQADLRAAMALRKRDPLAAQALLDRAFADAERRQQSELNVLRERATTDPKAAIELRKRLLRRLQSQKRVRQRAEGPSLKAPNREAFLQKLDHAASETEQELALVERDLERWRERQALP
jgi:hypothetical protein